jgi:hypothetical protein
MENFAQKNLRKFACRTLDFCECKKTPKTGAELFKYANIKGTVRPDWICMRVVSLESPLKVHQPLYVFDFLISLLNI